MGTICSGCNRKLEDSNVVGNFVCCKMCNRFSAKNNSVKGGFKMEEENMVKQKKEAEKPTKPAKNEKTFGKSRYVKCSKCGKECFTREDVYQSRIKKFGSEKTMLEKYICRNCRKQA